MPQPSAAPPASTRFGAAWERWVLPTLIEKACRGSVILDERRRVVPRATGHVLELGVGSGLNLPFYDPASVESVTGIDPSAALLQKAHDRASVSPLAGRISLLTQSAETLPFDAARFDSIVVTYTLCSVGDVRAVLTEARRVLRPGGSLFFVEHGLANDPGVAYWQRRITPLWRRVSGNCHLDRNIGDALTAAGFTLPELTARFTEGTVKALSFTFEGRAIVAG